MLARNQMDEYLQFLTQQGAQSDPASYEQGKKFAETLGGDTPQYTGAKSYAPLEQFLKQQFTNIRDPNAVPETREAFNLRASNAEDGGLKYDPNKLQTPAYLRYNPSMGFGGVSDRNNPIGIASLTPTGFAPSSTPNEYGGLEAGEGKPTGYTAALTNPFMQDGKRVEYRAKYDDKGQMVGDPFRVEVPHEDEGWGDFLLKAGLMVGGAAFGAPMLGELLGGASGVTAASLGELGINTGLTLGETLAGTGISEAALGELGINTGLTSAQAAQAASAAAALNTPWYQPFQQGLQSLKDVTDVGKYFTEAPAGVQKAITGAAQNFALSGGDPEAALRGAVTGGVGSFVDSYIPKDLQSVAKAGVQTALQGGSLEDMVKGTAFGAITDSVSKAVTGLTGYKEAGDIANAAIKQVITSGTIDPKEITVGMLAQVAGRAVGSETGNESLARATSGAVLGAVKGTDLNNLFNRFAKQVAIGAISTPTKKG